MKTLVAIIRPPVGLSKYYTIKSASPCTTLLRPHVSYFTFSPSNGGPPLHESGAWMCRRGGVPANPRRPAARFCTKKPRRYMYHLGSKTPLACLPRLYHSFLFLGGGTLYSAALVPISRGFLGVLVHGTERLCTSYVVVQVAVQADLIRSISFSPDLVSSQPSRALVIRRPAASAFSARTTRVW